MESTFNTIEREQMMQELIEARNLAEEKDRAKSEFLANMSHELRTPMHSILAFSKLGLKDLQNNNYDNVKNDLNEILSSGQQLLTLLNELLDLSKLESGHMNYDLRLDELRQVFINMVSGLQPLIDEKQLEVEVEETPTLVESYFDHFRMCQVVRNLLSNAIKFSPDKETVTIQIYEDLFQDRLHCHAAIIDRGPGVPEEERLNIFDQFAQGAKIRPDQEGTGLGLSICKKIMKAHGGAIWVEPNEYDGATFVIALPLEKEDTA